MAYDDSYIKLGQLGPQYYQNLLDQEEQLRQQSQPQGYENNPLIGGPGSSRLGSVIGSLLGSFSTAGEAISQMTDSDPTDGIQGLGADLTRFFKENIARENPEYAQNVPEKLASGLGSTLPVFAAGVLGGLSPVPGGALAASTAMGAAMMGKEGEDDYISTMRSQGKPINPSDASKAYWSNLVAQAPLELLAPLKAVKYFNKLDDVAKGGLKAAVTNAAKRTVEGTVTEALTEGLQQTAQNLIAKNIIKYDPERNLFVDAPESAAYGGGVGFLMNAALSAAGIRKAFKYEQAAQESNQPKEKGPPINPLTSQEYQNSDISKAASKIREYENILNNTMAPHVNPEMIQNRMDKLKEDIRGKYFAKDENGEYIKSEIDRQEASDFLTGIRTEPVEEIDYSKTPAPTYGEPESIPKKAPGIKVYEGKEGGKLEKEFNKGWEEKVKQHEERLAQKLSEARRKDLEDYDLLRPSTEGIDVTELPTDFPPPDGGGITVEEIPIEDIDIEKLDKLATQGIREAANDPEIGNAHVDRLNEAWNTIKTLVNTVEEAGITDATFMYDRAVKAFENADADTLEFIAKDLIKQVSNNPEAVARISEQSPTDRRYLELMQLVADGDKTIEERVAASKTLDEIDNAEDRGESLTVEEINALHEKLIQDVQEKPTAEILPFKQGEQNVQGMQEEQTKPEEEVSLPEDIDSLTPKEAQDLLDKEVEGPGYAIRDLEKKAKEKEIILTTKGKPYKTISQANIQLKKKGLQDTHEVIKHEDGFAIVSKKEEIKIESIKQETQPVQVPEPPTTIIDLESDNGILEDVVPEDKVVTPVGEVEKVEPISDKGTPDLSIEDQLSNLENEYESLREQLDDYEITDDEYYAAEKKLDQRRASLERQLVKERTKEAKDNKKAEKTTGEEEFTTQKLTKEEEDELARLDDADITEFDDPLEEAGDNTKDFDNYDNHFKRISIKSKVSGKTVIEAFKKRVNSTHKRLPIRFISSINDLSNADKVWLLDRYPNGPPNGLFITKDGFENEVWIFARKNGTKYRYARTLFHEVIGHYGLKNLFGSELGIFKSNMLRNEDLASKIYALNMRWKSIDLTPEGPGDTLYVNDKYTMDTLNQYASHIDRKPTARAFKKHGGSTRVPVSKKGMEYLAEEYLSEVAADLIDGNINMVSPQEQNIIKRFVAWVKHLLRRSGLGSYVDTIVNDEEILYIIQESAHRILADGRPIRDATGKPMNIHDLHTRVLSYMVDVYKGESPDKVARNLAKDLTKEVKYAKGLSLQEHLDNKTLTGKIIETKAEVEEVLRAGSVNRIWDEKEARGILASMNQREGRLDTSFRDRWAEKISDTVRRSKFGQFFSSTGKLPFPKVLSAIENPAKGAIELSERGARKWYSKIHVQSEGTKKAIFEYFTTKDGDINTIPENLRDIVTAYKDRIHNFGLELVRHGILDKETFDRHDGAYLPIMYWNYLEKYGTTGGKRLSFGHYLKQRKELSSLERERLGQIKDPSLLVSFSIATVERDVSLRTMFENMVTMNNVQKLGWFIPDPRNIKVGNKMMTLSEIEETIELNEQKLVIGEETNPTYTSKDGIQAIKDHIDLLKQARDAYTSERLTTGLRQTLATELGIPVEEISESMLAQFEGEFVKINDKRFGKLNKKWVRKELYDELVEGFKLYNMEGADFISKWFGPGGKAEQAHQYWKAGKVVFNPPSWARNGIGNWILLDIGTSTNTGKLITMISDEFKQLMDRKMSKYANIAHEWGLYNTTYSSAELGLIQDRASDFYKQQVPSLSNEFNMLPDSVRSMGWGFVKGIHWYLERATNFYGGMEGFFKTIALRDHIEKWEKKNGISIDNLPRDQREAVIRSGVEIANKNIFDYSKVPGWMRIARRQPFVGAPFLTYTFKAIPQSIDSFVRRPQKFIKYALFPTVVAQAFLAANDLDDDDMKYIQQNMPRWMKEKGSMFLLPTKDNNGNWQVIDFGYYLPWAAMHNTYLAYTNNIDTRNPLTLLQSASNTSWEVASDLGFLGGPLPSMISALKTNKDPFTGGEIVRSAGTPNDKANDFMRYMIDLWTPTFLTSKGVLGRTMDNIGMSAGWFNSGREFSAYGSDRETAGQTALRGVGVNVYGLNPREARLNKLKEYRIEKSKLMQVRTKYLRNSNLSKDEKVLKIKDINIQLKILTEQFHKELR